MAEKRTPFFTAPFRAAYANVFKPHAMEEGKNPKYGLCMLFPKKDPKVREFLKTLKAKCEALAKEHYPKGIPKNVKAWPLRDGDTERDSEEFAGMYFINSSTTRRPGVLDENNNPIMDTEEFYSGCWAIATVNPYWYDSNGNKGVAIGLNNLKKVRDDERLTGGASAEEEFGGTTTDDDEDLI